MQFEPIKIYAKNDNTIAIHVIPGHFATSHSHINYYIDMTSLKIRQKESAQAAACLSGYYASRTMIDTIVCMDGCEVIGALLAEELTRTGIMSINTHSTLYVITPEYNINNKLTFRDNIQPAIAGKHVLVLLASATTGKTILNSLECIEYYGGTIAGISAIFSAVDEIEGISVKSIFTPEDLPNYEAYDYNNCPLCKAGHKLDAIVNSYGYSEL